MALVTLLIGTTAEARAADHMTVEIAPGVRMPLLNAGNYNFSTNVSLWIELGGRGVDTAMTYGAGVQRDAGTAVAAAIASGLLKREEIFVTTKVPCCPFRHSLHSCHGQTAAQNAQEDLRLLGLDFADLILMHWPCDTTEQTLSSYASLETVVATGGARAIGVSNFNATLIRAVVSAAKVAKPAINQCEFSIGNHKPVETALGSDDITRAACAASGVTYSAYSPLGGLSGIDVLHDPTVLDVAGAHNRTAAQVALRYVVQKGIVAVTASTKATYDEQDLGIFGFAISEDEMAQLDSL